MQHPELPGVFLILLLQFAFAVMLLFFGLVFGLVQTILLGPVAGIYVATSLWLVALPLIAAGLGLLNRKNWARLLSIAFAVLATVLTLANSKLRGSVVALIVVITAPTISWYLMRAKVRADFT